MCSIDLCRRFWQPDRQYVLWFAFSDSNPFALATLFPAGGGYATFFHGKVVDMLYFPLIHTQYPSWFPIPSWRGEDFDFFAPVFNLADSSISIGVIALLIWQKKFFPAKHDTKNSITTASATEVNTPEIKDEMKTM